MSALRNVPNILSWSRMLSVVPLHALALRDEARWLAAGLLIAGATDILDGILARRLACASNYGSKLDTIADNVLGLAMVLWLVMLCPALVADNVRLVIYITGVTALPHGLARLRHGRIIPLHTYTARFAALCAYGLALHVLAGEIGGYRALTLLLAFAVTIKAVDECLILMLTDGVTAGQQSSILAWWSDSRRAGLRPGSDGDDRGIAGFVAYSEHDRIISRRQ